MYSRHGAGATSCAILLRFFTDLPTAFDIGISYFNLHRSFRLLTHLATVPLKTLYWD
jgi:hypothetical protein